MSGSMVPLASGEQSGVLNDSLRYPLRERDGLRRLLVLSVVQIVPLFGQLILTGYGLAVVRATVAGDDDLPPLHWGAALADGTRLLVAGLLYLLPILAIVPMILTTGMTQSGAASGGVSPLLGILVVVGLTAVAGPLLTRVPASARWVTSLVGVVAMLLPLGLLGWTVINLATREAPLIGGSLNGVGILLSVGLALVVGAIALALPVSGMRYAVEGTGLFDPTATWRLLAQHGRQSATLALHLLILVVLTAAGTAVGLVLLVVPGLLVLVVGALAFWRRVARFGLQVGIHPPAGGKAAESTALPPQPAPASASEGRA